MKPEATLRLAPVLSRPRVSVRIVDGCRLDGLGPAWDDLVDNAIEDNPFFARPYVTAALSTIEDASNLKGLCILLSQPDGAERLIGFLPMRSTLFRYGVPVQVDLVSLNAYQTSGTPLIHRDHGEMAVDAILDAVRNGANVARNKLMHNMRRDGPVARLFAERAPRHGLAATFLDELRRPVLRPDAPTAAEHFSRHVAPKRLRELRRNHRRLMEMGRLSFSRAEEPVGLAAAVEAFLRIEEAGWKGRAGTAFLSSAAGAAFARAAFAGVCSGRPIASADVLSLDDQPIAVSLNLQTGRTAFAVKCAYDEAFRRHAPGLVLEYLVIEHLFATRFADEVDSCVTEAGHVIQTLWNGEAAVGTLVLRAAGSVPAGLGGIFGLDLAAAEKRRTTARARVKDVYHVARRELSSVGARAITARAALRQEAGRLRAGLSRRWARSPLRRRVTIALASTLPPESDLLLAFAAII